MPNSLIGATILTCLWAGTCHAVQAEAPEDGGGTPPRSRPAAASALAVLAQEEQAEGEDTGVQRPSVPLDLNPEKPDSPAGFWERDELLGDPGGIRSRLRQAGVKIELQDVNQAMANLAGGIRRGVRYTGETDFNLTIDLAKVAHWPGGTIFASVEWLRGRSPTQDLVGSLQPVSYTEIGESGLRDLWLEQSFAGGVVSARAGQERVDEEFLHTRWGEVLVNSTFSWPGLANVDLQYDSPSYFLSMPFARIAVQPSQNVRLLGAIFKGNTSTLHGSLAIAEGQFRTEPLLGVTLPGIFRAGAVYQSGRFEDQFIPGWTHHDTGSAYFGIDQTIWRRAGDGEQEIGVFARAMVAGKHSLVDLYFDGGVSLKGAIPSRPGDMFGVGVAYLRTSKEAQNQAAAFLAAEELVQPLPNYELVLEASYIAQLTGWLQLQPDVQYIIHPNADLPRSEQPELLKNSFVIGLRVIGTF